MHNRINSNTNRAQVPKVKKRQSPVVAVRDKYGNRDVKTQHLEHLGPDKKKNFLECWEKKNHVQNTKHVQKF